MKPEAVAYCEQLKLALPKWLMDKDQAQCWTIPKGTMQGDPRSLGFLLVGC